MEQGLKLIISADGSEVIKTLQQLENELKQFKSQLSTATNVNEIARLNTAIQNTQSRITNLRNINPFSKVKPGANEATQSIINLSRVVQDAPYGFIGIANNINPLLESFQRLRTQSGSLKGALSALFTGITGAGGLGLLVGILTSLPLFFGNSSKAADNNTKILEKNSKAAEEAANHEREFQSQLDRATSSVIQQAGQLDDLKTVLTQTTGEAGKLTDATIKLGVAQFLFNTKNEAVQRLLNAQVQQFLRLKQGVGQAPEITFEGLESSVDPITKKIAVAKDDIRKVNDLSKGLEDTINSLFKKQFTKDDGGEKIKDGNKDVADALQERKNILLEFIRDFETIKVPFPDLSKSLENFDNTELTNELRAKLRDAIGKALLSIQSQKFAVPKELKPNVDTKFSIPLKIQVSIQEDIDEAEDVQKKIEERKKQIKATLQAAVGEIATTSFSGIGEAIGAALSGGDLQNVFSSLFSFIGGAIADLGKQMIALSPILAALKAAIKTLNPVLLLPAGIALVAIGTTLRSLKPKGFARGGDVPGSGNSDTVPAMLTPGEYVATKEDAPLVKAFLKLIKGGLPSSSVFNSVQHFALGGEVRPTNFFQPVTNVIQPQVQASPRPILIQNSEIMKHEISGDTLRLWIARANKQGGYFN